MFECQWRDGAPFLKGSLVAAGSRRDGRREEEGGGARRQADGTKSSKLPPLDLFLGKSEYHGRLPPRENNSWGLICQSIQKKPILRLILCETTNCL